jgi:glycosyltransferase involved in cell wall biosynthesis
MQTISIVMTYYNRPQQLTLTLKTLKEYYDDAVNIVIVDDGSAEGFEAKKVTDRFDMNIAVLYIPKEEKTWVNPCIPFNKGFALATGDIVVIQNPESLHIGNCLKYIRQNLTNENYLAFSCYATTKQQHRMLASLLSCNKKELQTNLKNSIALNEREQWYSHPQLNPTGYHFLSAITKTNLDRVGGFDTVFASGYCFDDNEFVWRMKKFLKFVIVNPDCGCYCIHQWHCKNPDLRGGSPLWEKNKQLWLRITGGK